MYQLNHPTEFTFIPAKRKHVIEMSQWDAAEEESLVLRSRCDGEGPGGNESDVEAPRFELSVGKADAGFLAVMFAANHCCENIRLLSLHN